jgi:hypothetical protein
LTRLDPPGNEELDALAQRVLEAHAALDTGLHESGRRFPVAAIEMLWRAVLEYSAAMKGLKWLHRDVVRELSGLREYLELATFKTPSDVLRTADRIECMLFAGYDPYPEDDEGPYSKTMLGEKGHEFGLREDQCAGCEAFDRVDELGLCENCSAKLERDLIRERDWAYSVTAYGLNDEKREEVRRQIVGEFGEDLELIAPSRRVKPKRQRWRGRKPK